MTESVYLRRCEARDIEHCKILGNLRRRTIHEKYNIFINSISFAVNCEHYKCEPSALAGVNVQKSLNIAGQTFFLRGAAVRHMGPFGTFKGYIMAVYQLQEDISKQNIPAVKSPTVLWTHSFYDLDKESLQNMFSLSFKITSTKRMLSRIRPAIHRFLEVLPAVRDGNQIIFVADPTTGVTLVRARDTQKSIRSPLLARAVLDIWLGPTPTSREFKSKLLADN